jgi:hypothetical protein
VDKLKEVRESDDLVNLLKHFKQQERVIEILKDVIYSI